MKHKDLKKRVKYGAFKDKQLMTRPLRYQSDFLSRDADPLTWEQEATPNPDAS